LPGRSAAPPAEAVAWYQRALRLNREIGSRWGEAETLGHIGDASYAVGRPDDARAAWQEALAILDELNHPDAALARAKLSQLSPAARAPSPTG
jgi:tetratricopeptide (TPR) repeat protein